jgi:hypothetical protein
MKITVFFDVTLFSLVDRKNISKETPVSIFRIEHSSTLKMVTADFTKVLTSHLKRQQAIFRVDYCDNLNSQIHLTVLHVEVNIML